MNIEDEELKKLESELNRQVREAIEFRQAQRDNEYIIKWHIMRGCTGIWQKINQIHHFYLEVI